MLLPRSIADIEDHRKTHRLLIAPKRPYTNIAATECHAAYHLL
jgi:hypothetical protein